MDYDSADARIYGDANYERYVWPVNNYYTAADSAIRYCIVAFDSLFDAYGNVGYNHDSVSNLAVDSIFLMLGQENNSGTDDTLRVKLIGVDNVHGYPVLTTVYWTTDVIIPFGTPLSGNWKAPVQLKFTPFTSIYYPKFAIQMEYFGSKMDTLGIVAGFGFRDTCSATNMLNADTTHFSKIRKQTNTDSLIANSFAMWSQFQTVGLLPTKNGANVFYDCNGNTQYDGGSDGESYIQNIQFIAHVKTNAAGVHENNSIIASLDQNYPNPFSNSTTIGYELKQESSVTLDIFDISGRKIVSQKEADQGIGKHHIDLSATNLEAGTYFYTLTAGYSRMTRKMTLIR